MLRRSIYLAFMKTIHLLTGLLLSLMLRAQSPNDVVINEILFNPRPDGVDYVEIYNRSDKPLDIKDLYLTNRSASGSMGTPKALTKQSRMLKPGDYLVITEDPYVVQKQYNVSDTTAFIKLSPMPSYPDAGGTVLLLNAQNVILDELQYSEKWHFRLIDNKEGISLERINANQPTQDQNNWHSAATTAGYGTPSYKNSQFNNTGQTEEMFSVEPDIFSPDSDGFNDYAIIKYKFPEPGYVCNITIFNISGYPVRYVARNALCGAEGYFKWDGLDEKSSRIAIGTYIMFAEVFNLKGKTFRYKRAITLAKPLN